MLKNTFLFLVFILFSSHVDAQYSSEGDLVSRFRPGAMWFYTGLRPAIPEKVRKYDRLVFDLTYNDWLSKDQKPFKNHWASIGLNSSIYFDIPLAKKNTVSLGIGLGHSFSVIRHNNLFVPDTTSTYTQYTLVENPTFNRNSLVGHSVFLPIELRIRTSGWKHFKVHVGGRIGYQFGLYQKAVFDGENGKVISKSFDLPDVSRLTYGIHARIGIRNWSIFGAYHLNTIFHSSSSIKLNHLQLGIGISLF